MKTFGFLLIILLLALLGWRLYQFAQPVAACNLTSLVSASSLLGAPDPFDVHAFLARLSTPVQNPDACQSFNQGLRAYRGGDLDRARSYFTQALPGSAIYLDPIRSFFQDDQILADVALQTYPENPVAWEWAASANADQPVLSLEFLRRSAELQPTDNLVWERLGQLAEQLGNTDLALIALRNACDIYPVRNGACLSAARFFFERQDWENTIMYYQIGSYPEHPDQWARLVLAARHLGRLGDAQRFLERAELENPADYEALFAALDNTQNP
jgi:tetratricopeptide (TPR) repeat protein